jgi:hypothetical protein
MKRHDFSFRSIDSMRSQFPPPQRENSSARQERERFGIHGITKTKGKENQTDKQGKSKLSLRRYGIHSRLLPVSSLESYAE